MEYENDQMWTLSFDGSKSKNGSWASVELVSPTRETYLVAHRLQFPFANNVPEYESLVIGLLLAIQKGAKILHVHGDSNIVVGQVCKRYTCHGKRLGHYHKRFWDLIESFDDFNVKRINQTRNLVANCLS